MFKTVTVTLRNSSLVCFGFYWLKIRRCQTNRVLPYWRPSLISEGPDSSIWIVIVLQISPLGGSRNDQTQFWEPQMAFFHLPKNLDRQVKNQSTAVASDKVTNSRGGIPAWCDAVALSCGTCFGSFCAVVSSNSVVVILSRVLSRFC